MNLQIANTRDLKVLLYPKNKNNKDEKSKTFPTMIDRFVKDLTRISHFERMWLKYKEANLDLSMGIEQISILEDAIQKNKTSAKVVMGYVV